MPYYPAKRKLLADKRSDNNNNNIFFIIIISIKNTCPSCQNNNNNNNNNEDVAVLSHIFIPIHLRLSSMCYNLLLYGIKVALFNK